MTHCFISNHLHILRIIFICCLIENCNILISFFHQLAHHKTRFRNRCTIFYVRQSWNFIFIYRQKLWCINYIFINRIDICQLFIYCIFCRFISFTVTQIFWFFIYFRIRWCFRFSIWFSIWWCFSHFIWFHIWWYFSLFNIDILVRIYICC